MNKSSSTHKSHYLQRLVNVNSLKKHTFYIYFVCFLCIILFCVLLLGTITYFYTARTFEDEVIGSTSSSINQATKALESTLLEIDNITFQVGLEGSVTNYLHNTDNRFLLNDINDTISYYYQSNRSLLNSIELYTLNNKNSLSSMGATQLFNDQNSFYWISAMNFSEKRNLWLDPRKYITSDYEKIDVVSYVRKLPVGDNNALGYIALHLNEAYISKLVNKFHDNANTYIANSEGLIIASQDKDTISTPIDEHYLREINSNSKPSGFIRSRHNNLLLFYERNNLNDWIIISKIPYSYITDKTRPILITTLILCLLIILLGIIMAYYLSVKLYQPIDSLVATVDKLHTDSTQREKSEFSYITKVVESIENHNKDLKHNLFINTPTLKEKVVFDLVHNKYATHEDITKQFSLLNINMNCNNYVFILLDVLNFHQVIDTEQNSDVNLYLFAIKNIVTEIFDSTRPIICTDLDKQSIGIIVNLNSYNSIEENSILYKLIQDSQDTVFQLLKLETRFIVGNDYPDILDVAQSYYEVMDLYKYHFILDKKICFYNDYNNNPSYNYYYPIKIINHISNNLKTGDDQKIAAYIQIIVTHIKENENLSPENIFRIFNHIIDSLLLTLQELSIPLSAVVEEGRFIYGELSEKKSIDDIQVWLNDIFKSCCHMIQKQNNTNSYVKDIVAYINAHFAQDLYIDSIADYIKLNPTYMCRIFKEETNNTVLEFITKVRLEEGKKALINSNTTITHIAQSIGYNSVHTFMRHFKAQEGITPGNYRKINRIDKAQ